MTNIHLLGANHSAAKYLVSSSLLSGFSLYLYTRNIPSNSAFSPYSDLPNNLEPSDIVICLIPINYASDLIRSLFKDISLPSAFFVFLSSTSILSKLNTNSLDAPQYSFFEMGELSLKSFFATHPQCRLFVIRLPLLWGFQQDKNIHRLYSFASRFGFIPLSSNSVGLRAPIHISQLSKVLASLCESVQSVPSGTYNLMGPHVLSYYEICCHIVNQIQFTHRCHLLFLPQFVLKFLLSFVRIFRISFLYGFLEKFNRQSKSLVYPDNSIFEYIPSLPFVSFKTLLHQEYTLR